MKSMKKTGGLRKRWLLNTVGVVFALGLVCVMAVTASYATYYYSNMQSDMENRAKTTTDFFADYINQDYGDYYQSCITYAKTFEDKGKIELQFINNQGSLVASSYGPWAGPSAAAIPDRRWRGYGFRHRQMCGQCRSHRGHPVGQHPARISPPAWTAGRNPSP